MHETFMKIASDERSRHGLVIMSATYGALLQGNSSQSSDPEILDVTVPIQCLVRDSRLDLHDSTKVSCSNFELF